MDLANLCQQIALPRTYACQTAQLHIHVHNDSTAGEGTNRSLHVAIDRIPDDNMRNVIPESERERTRTILIGSGDRHDLNVRSAV